MSLKEFNRLLSSTFDKIQREEKKLYMSVVILITDHSASIIDNIYCDVPIQGSDYHVGVLTFSISDHYGIFCVNNSSKIQNKNTQIVKRSFCDRNIANFKKRLLQESWDFVYESSDLHSTFSRFQVVIDLHLNILSSKSGLS